MLHELINIEINITKPFLLHSLFKAFGFIWNAHRNMALFTLCKYFITYRCLGEIMIKQGLHQAEKWFSVCLSHL